MKEHLAQIYRATASDRYAVIIMDGAGWHSDDIDAGFNNISIVKLLPYSPEESDRTSMELDAPRSLSESKF